MDQEEDGTDRVERELLTSTFVRFAPGFAVPFGAWRRGVSVVTLTGQLLVGAIRSERSNDGFGFAASLTVRFGRDEKARDPYRPSRTRAPESSSRPVT